MRKSRRNTGRRQPPPVTLFSFLDILGGTIGVLILIISVFFIQLRAGKQIVQLVADTSKIEASTPSYIICNGNDNVEIHEQGMSYVTRISDKRISQLIERIKQSKGKQYLIIGVRPNGFDDFERLRSWGETAGISLGYEPLDEGWRIRAPGGKLL
jgi:hypothetical protein